MSGFSRLVDGIRKGNLADNNKIRYEDDIRIDFICKLRL